MRVSRPVEIAPSTQPGIADQLILDEVTVSDSAGLSSLLVVNVFAYLVLLLAQRPLA